jgi:hypothetical protein
VKRNILRGCILYLIIITILTIGTLLAGTARAADVSGTWTSTTSGRGFIDETWPGNYYDDATLNLGSGSSIDGTFSVTVRSVQVKQSGYGVEDAVDTSNTWTISGGYSSGSTVSLPVSDSWGNTFTMTLTENNGRMTGSGSYTNYNYNVIHTWSMDVTRTGGGGAGLGSFDASILAIPAAIIGLTGAVASLAASAIPPPRTVPPHHPQSPPGNMHYAGYGHMPIQRIPPNIYGNIRPPVTAAPGDARFESPQQFYPLAPEPDKTTLLDGSGTLQSPPDKLPPPNPPRGDEKPTDNNPTCPICHNKTIPSWGRTGWRWWCYLHGFVWGE